MAPPPPSTHVPGGSISSPYISSPLRNGAITPTPSDIPRPHSRNSISRKPVPSYGGYDGGRPGTPDRYPPLPLPSEVPLPRTPPRPLKARSRASTPTSLRTALNTALPSTPPRAPVTPPRSTREAEEELELEEISLRGDSRKAGDILGSPFHDRHSIVVDEVQGEEEVWVLNSPESNSSGSPRGRGAGREKTMVGYRFAGSPSPAEKEELDLRGALSPRSKMEYRRSIYPASLPIPAKTLADHPDLLHSSSSSPSASPLPPPLPRGLPPLRPRFRRLFALSPSRDIVAHLIPAVTLSIAASVVQPYMSVIIGDAFAIFTRYPLFTWGATEADRLALREGVKDTSMKLGLAGLYGVVLNYSKGVAWARHGEAIVARLREAVYVGVAGKSMMWYDMGMGMKAEEEEAQGESIGAGGLMAKFARETDDVRIGTSQVFGLAVQNFSTFLLCFILALVKSPILALVTLSTIPLVVLVQIITQVFCGPLYAAERRAFAEASTNVERATSAIATVKAHNAQKSEVERFKALIQRATGVLGKQAVVWGVSIALTDFLLLGTFVVGFWYGAKVVRDGGSAGDVMTTFWACLLAASYLQSLVPQLSSLTKAKMSMASLLTIIQPEISSTPNPFSPASTPTSATFAAASRVQSIKRITPIRCHGEFNFQNVSFAYPSRADNLVLRDITLFLPPHETTFIVGGSGSGKSTIAQLLLQLYAPLGGEITLDDNSLPFLDAAFARQHIAAVSQGCILFDMSIHDNVAIGLAGAGPNVLGITRGPGDVSRREVEEACRVAMIHDFITGLPEGYETKLGTGGSSLSGGQKQRLAIARAKIRDPTVLILDEATSALDATSRVAVFENIKKWRQNRTTIVITHDLSQIVPDDFVYVMKDGVVAEQGFRSDLMKKSPLHGNALGIFAGMAAEQAIAPLPAREEEIDFSRPEDEVEEILSGVERSTSRRQSRPHTPSFTMRPGSAMYLDILDEYARGGRFSVLDPSPSKGSPARPLSIAQKRLSWAPPVDRSPSRNSVTPTRTPSFAGGRNSFYGGGGSCTSVFIPNTPGSRMSRLPSHESLRPSSLHYLSPAAALTTPPQHRPIHDYRSRTLSQNLDDDLKSSQLDIAVLPPLPGNLVPVDDAKERLPGMFALLRKFYPTLPRKLLLWTGVLGSLAHGVSTPVWSFFLTKLMQIVGSGGTDPSLSKWGAVVLAISAAQGLAYFFQEYCLSYSAVFWTSEIRDVAYGNVLAQDKAWFDEGRNDPARLVQILIKDADDMRALMGDVVGKVAVFVSMIGLGIVWAMVVGWRLTLIGVALAPVFGGIIMANEVLIGRAEVRNKRRREVLAKTFYESVSNIRGIRAMALDSSFADQFHQNALDARRTGVHAGWVVSIGTAFSAGLPLFAMALMNFAGAEFMLHNYMNYVEMLQVYNLVLFSLTFGTQALDFIPLLAKIKASARDFNRLYDLSLTTGESTGDLRFPISGNVTFSNLSFTYPSRPDVPIFSDLSFSLVPGECVAIVGPSGSGKSTIAALLQRLYDPVGGSIHLDKYDLQRAEVKWLRNHIAVVSQTANLFDATVAENIAYGSEVPLMEIHRAAKAANIHDFIVSLPEGYDTNLGENASLISGGQAQRLQIARALVRRSNILILDECTSALDVENQRAIVETIVKVKDTRTVVFITHSLEAIKRCDRIICLGEGRVVEDGTFEQLSTKRGGVFAQLMKTGEWE